MLTKNHYKLKESRVLKVKEFCTENKDFGLNYSINFDERFHSIIKVNNAWEGMTCGLDYLPDYPI